MANNKHPQFIIRQKAYKYNYITNNNIHPDNLKRLSDDYFFIIFGGY